MNCKHVSNLIATLARAWVSNRLVTVATIELRRNWIAVVLPTVIVIASANQSVAAEADFPNDLRERAVGELRRALHEEPEFVKVHAAEALLALGYPEGVGEVFELEASEHQHKPIYRVGIWRVLARAGNSEVRRQDMIRRLRDVFLDSSAPDQIHAVESLAKLRYEIPPDERAAFEDAAKSESTGLALFTNWSLSQSFDGPYQQRISAPLDSDDPVTRLRAAYILRHLPNLSKENRTKLKKTAKNEPVDTITYAYVVGSSFVVANAYRDHDEAACSRAELLRIARTGKLREKYAACEAFAECGVIDDLPLLTNLLKNGEPDVRVSAALAILKIVRRRDRSK